MPTLLPTGYENLCKPHPARLAKDKAEAETRAAERRARDAAAPTPATHAILTRLKAGETVYQTGEVPKTL